MPRHWTAHSDRDEPKFTPGPWVFEHVRGNHFTSSPELTFPDGSGVPLGAVSDADGHLIAAAPDLYAALETLLAMQDQMRRKPGGGVLPADYGIARGKAHAALARARGES